MKVFVFVFLTILVLIIIGASLIYPQGIPMLFRIGGTVTTDGVQITQANDDGLVIKVTKLDGSNLTNLNGHNPQDTDGLNASNYYIIDIPIYDASYQPGGATPGDTVRICVYKNGQELQVASPTNGEITVGSAGSTSQINLEVRSSGPSQPTRCDFNNDGKTDILWRNKTTGQNVVWFMDVVARSGWSWIIPQVTDTNWEIVGTGDFNGDGKTDILWRNKSTGENEVWFMDGTTFKNWAPILQVTDTNWQIVGTGDFNSDGKVDILWRNKSTGQNGVWLMDGTTFKNWAPILQVTDTNWQIVGTGDFNSDGKVDILWRNKSTDQNGVWFMDGTTLSSYVELLQVTDTNWEIVGPK